MYYKNRFNKLMTFIYIQNNMLFLNRDNKLLFKNEKNECSKSASNIYKIKKLCVKSCARRETSLCNGVRKGNGFS